MEITHEVERMKKVACPKGHGPAELPQEGNWTQVKEIRDISGLSHGIGWCAPQQGCCKLTLNVKNGKTLLEALNTHLACDAINVAMREIFKQMVYGRTQTAFSENGLPIGASLEDLGKGLCSQCGSVFSTLEKGPRMLQMAEGYVLDMALNEEKETVGYRFVHLGKMMDLIRAGKDHKEAYESCIGTYGQYEGASEYIDPRKE